MFSCEVVLVTKDSNQSIKLDAFFDSRCKDEIFEVIAHAAALGLDVVIETEYFETKEENE